VVSLTSMLSEADRKIHQADGQLRWAYPISGSIKTPWIDVDRDTGAFVNALLEAPGGTQVVGASEYLNGS
ncbi:hypothetical protein LTR80_012428, partial [Exophiala xenobiotica]